MMKLSGCLVAATIVAGGCVVGEYQSGRGVSTLVRVDPEPEGANCANGGVVVHTGRDANQNGQVDDDEIDASQFVCSGDDGLRCEGEPSLTGVVTVFDTPDLAQLTDATCIDGDLVIAGLPDGALPDLPLVRVTGGITIAGNAKLRSLGGLGRVTELGGPYAVQGNDELVDVSALGVLARAPSVILVGNDALVDLAGLEAWVDIEHHVTISNNGSLTSLHGLEGLLGSTGVLNIKGNRSLSSLAALEHLRSVAVLEISGNPELSALELGDLEKVNVTLVANNNAALTAVALPSLATASGIQLSNNPALATVDLPSLVVTSVFLIQLDTALTSLSAPRFAAATGQVDLLSLPALAALDLGALGSVGGALNLSGLGGLTDLSGFSRLTSVVGDLTIANNPSLISLTGVLGVLTSVGGNLIITGNPQLPASDAEALAQSVAVTGTTTLQ